MEVRLSPADGRGAQVKPVPRAAVNGGYGLGKGQPLLRQAARAPGVVVERHWLSVALSGGRTRLPVEVIT